MRPQKRYLALASWHTVLLLLCVTMGSLWAGHLAQLDTIGTYQGCLAEDYFYLAGIAIFGLPALVFPVALEASGLLALPELMVMLVMVFWLFRVGRSPVKA